MKKILITGATGFFGTSVLQALMPQKDTLYICVSSKAIEPKYDNRFQWVQCDLLDAAQRESLIQTYKPTHLVHLAWHVPPKQFWHAYENIEWLYASLHLFKLFNQEGGKHFIGAGTMYEYDFSSTVLNEDAAIKPMTLYAEAKVSLYNLITHLNETADAKSVIQWLRLGYFFGEHEAQGKLLSMVVSKMLANEPITLVDQDTVRDYGHVKYVGHAIKELLDNEENQILNTSGGTQYTLKEILDYIRKKLNSKSDMLYNAYTPPAHEPLKIISDITKLKTRFHIDPSRTFWQDLDGFVQYHIQKQ